MHFCQAKSENLKKIKMHPDRKLKVLENKVVLDFLKNAYLKIHGPLKISLKNP